MLTCCRMLAGVLTIAGMITGCSDPFALSPFDARVKEEFRNTTEKNLLKLAAVDSAEGGAFRVALISDSHYHFNHLRDAVDDIDQKGSYTFVIVTGDFTENGLLSEFEIFRQIMERLRIPYLTVIGNHDHLSNGSEIYEQMFGPRNYTFSFGNAIFIAWDNTIWESESDADFSWLASSLAAPRASETFSSYTHVIPLSHIPPFDGQLVAKADLFHELLKKNKVSLSIHGHKHGFWLADHYGDGILYMTVGTPQKRNYAELLVTQDTVIVSKINY